MLLDNLLNGSLLGDGAVCRQHDKRQDTWNYSYNESHGFAQLDYLMWKAEILREHGFRPSVYSRTRSIAFEGRTITSHETTIGCYDNTFFRPLREQWYPCEEKQVPGDFLLTPDAAAVWYQDDGSFHHFRGCAVLCTDGFNLQSQHLLQRELGKFNVVASIVGSPSRQRYRLYLPRTEAWKFLSLVEPYLHPCMRYKCPVDYIQFAETRRHKTAGRTISLKTPLDEARQTITENLQTFHDETCQDLDGFPVVRYLHWPRSFSHKPIQRLFGSFEAALAHAGLPTAFV